MRIRVSRCGSELASGHQRHSHHSPSPIRNPSAATTGWTAIHRSHCLSLSSSIDAASSSPRASAARTRRRPSRPEPRGASPRATRRLPRRMRTRAMRRTRQAMRPEGGRGWASSSRAAHGRAWESWPGRTPAQRGCRSPRVRAWRPNQRLCP
ncbi:hypothetical protein HMPREF1503_1156 [Olsenella uli MSTE5]|nr:hypothetical protein HMPREF1503_1156 [Olsenella uli MSTE5]